MFDINITSLVAFAIAGTLILVLVGIILRLRFKLKNAANLLVQKMFDEGILQNQLMKMRSEKALEQNDDFIKFISESRDWAFSYIEDVQQSIQHLKIAVESGYEIEEELAQLFSHLPDNEEKQ